jgi:hypothetical protein
MKLASLEGEFQTCFVAYRENDVVPRMTTRSATVDITVEWREK